MSLFIKFTNYLFQMDSIINIYLLFYSFYYFNDIFTLIFYVMDELI